MVSSLRSFHFLLQQWTTSVLFFSFEHIVAVASFAICSPLSSSVFACPSRKKLPIEPVQKFELGHSSRPCSSKYPSGLGCRASVVDDAAELIESSGRERVHISLCSQSL